MPPRCPTPWPGTASAWLGCRGAWVPWRGLAFLGTPVLASSAAAVRHGRARDGVGVAGLPMSLVHQDLALGSLSLAGDETWHIAVEMRLFRPKARQSAAAEELWAAIH